MKARIINRHERAIGTQAGLLPPGESVELELTDAEFKDWEQISYVEVSDLDRSKGSSHKKAAAKSDD